MIHDLLLYGGGAAIGLLFPIIVLMLEGMEEHG